MVGRAEGWKCEGMAVAVLACVFVSGEAETAGMAKISNKTGEEQNDKLQNIIQSKAIRGEMNETEME